MYRYIVVYIQRFRGGVHDFLSNTAVRAMNAGSLLRFIPRTSKCIVFKYRVYTHADRLSHAESFSVPAGDTYVSNAGSIEHRVRISTSKQNESWFNEVADFLSKRKLVQ